MAFDLTGARAEGYDDAQIADHLASLHKYDVAGARAEGYTDTQIAEHLAQKNTTLAGVKNAASSIINPDAAQSVMDSYSPTQSTPSLGIEVSPTGAVTSEADMSRQRVQDRALILDEEARQRATTAPAQPAVTYSSPLEKANAERVANEQRLRDEANRRTDTGLEMLNERSDIAPEELAARNMQSGMDEDRRNLAGDRNKAFYASEEGRRETLRTQALGDDANALAARLALNDGSVERGPYVDPAELARQEQAKPKTFGAITSNALNRAAITGANTARQMTALAVGSVGATDTAKDLLGDAKSRSEYMAQNYPSAVTSVSDSKSIGDAATRLYEGIIENAPMMITSIGAGIGGKALAELLVKKGASVAERAAAGTFGAAAGAGTSSIGMESGSIYGDIYDSTGQMREGVAISFGAIAGALDAYPAFRLVGTLTKHQLAGEIGKTVIQRYGIEGLKQAGFEAGTEGIQTLIEKGAITFVDGRPLLSKQNLLEALDAAFIGGGMGAGAHVVSQGANDAFAKPSSEFVSAPSPSLTPVQQSIADTFRRLDESKAAFQAVLNRSREASAANPGSVRASDLQGTPEQNLADDILSQGDIRQPSTAQAADTSLKAATAEQPAPHSSVDVVAHGAATSPLNDLPEPTQAQKLAGNYKKAHVRIHGLDVAIENPQGSQRSGTDPNGQAWSVTLPNHYGYIKRTEGADGDHVDTYIGPNPESDKVFVVDQVDHTNGKFDEHKIMMGYGRMEDAMSAYQAAFSDGNGHARIGSVTPMTVDGFKTWLKEGDTKSPAAIQTRHVQKLEADKTAPSGMSVERIGTDSIQPTLGAAPNTSGSDHVPKPSAAIKPYVETLIKNRKTAAELGMAFHFDLVVGTAKKAMNGGDVAPAKLRTLAARYKSAPEIVNALNGIADILAPAPVKAKVQRSASTDLLRRIIQLGGINSKYTSDITGEKRPNGAWKFAFGKSGLGLDDLATQLAADGFSIDMNSETDNGGVDQLTEMIRKHMGGERAFKAQTIEAKAEASVNDAKHAYAYKLGIKTAGLSESELDDAIYMAEDAIAMEEIAKQESVDEAEALAIQQVANAVEDGEEIPFGENNVQSNTENTSGIAERGKSSEGATRGENTLGTSQSGEGKAGQDEQSESSGTATLNLSAPTVSASGAPFKNQKLAQSSIRQRRLDAVPVEVDGGWGIQLVQPSGVISDLGEKIGMARKDTATSRGGRITKEAADTSESDATWRKRFEAVQLNEQVDQPWFILDRKTRRFVRGDGYRNQEFSSKEAAEKVIPLAAVALKHRVTLTSRNGEPEVYEIKRDVTDRKRITVVPEKFASREEAMKYMAEHAAEIIETKTSFGEEILPKPETVNRIGAVRRKGNVVGKDFMDTFGFRGVEFGNWNNQEERQDVLNHAYDGLLDLAEVLNVPPKAISLNGDLALAFGARGQGLSGARAHYERNRAVINLTKMSGAGALAHEWLHSLDHYLGRLDGKAKGEMAAGEDGTKTFGETSVTDYASHGFSYDTKMRTELQTAYKELLETMFYKAEKYVEDTQKAEEWLGRARDGLRAELDKTRAYLARQLDPAYWKRNNKPASAEQLAKFDELADMLIEGQDLGVKPYFDDKKKVAGRLNNAMRMSNETLESLNGIIKEVRGRSGFNAAREGLLDGIRHPMSNYQQRITMLEEARNATEKTKRIPTDYRKDATEIDQGRASDYWATEHEMAARAFSSYVEDKLAEKGNSSDFLSYGSKGRVPTAFGWVRPFPAGEERVAINKAFDKFFETVKTKETDKGVALFSKGDPISKGMTKEQVSNIAMPIVEKLKNVRTVEIVERQDQIPGLSDAVKSAFEQFQREQTDESRQNYIDVSRNNIEGAYVDGKIYLVANNLSNPDRIEEVLRHEVAHLSVKEMLEQVQPGLYANLIKQVRMLSAGGNLYIKKLGELVDARQPGLDRDTRAEEIIALIAERNDHEKEFSPAVRTMWQKLSDAIRAFYKLVFGDKLTDQDVRDIVAQSFRWAHGEGDATPHVIGGTENAEAMYSVSGDTGQNVPESLDFTQVELEKEKYLQIVRKMEQLYGGEEGYEKLKTSYDAFVRGHGDTAHEYRPELSGIRHLKNVSQRIYRVLGEGSGGGAFASRTSQGKIGNIQGFITEAKLQEIPHYGHYFVLEVWPSEFDGRNGVLDEPVLTVTINPTSGTEFTKDSPNGELVIYGPKFDSETFRILKKMGWADVATGKNGKVAYMPDGRPWTKLTNSNSTQVGALLADVHARMRLITEAPHIGIDWDRATGATGFAIEDGDKEASRKGYVLFSRSGKGFILPEETKLRAAQRNVQDHQIRWDVVQQAIKEQGGVVNETNDVFLSLKLYSGRVAAAFEAFQRQTLEPILERSAKAKIPLEEVAEYLYARHAQERNEQIAKINSELPDGGSGMTTAEANNILAGFKARKNFAEIKSIADDLQSITDRTLKMLVRFGVFSQEHVDAYKNTYKHYVPLKGFEQIDEDGKPAGTGQGHSTPSKLGKRALGRKSRAGQIIENIVRDHEAAILACEKANIGARVREFVMDNPDRKLWTVEMVPVSKQIANGMVSMRKAQFDPEKEIRFIEGDKEVRIQLHDPLLLRAYNKLGFDQMGKLFELSGHFLGFLRQMYTQKNPAFFLINPIRDVQDLGISLTGYAGGAVAAKAFKHWPGAWLAMARYAEQEKSTSTLVGRNTVGKDAKEWQPWIDQFKANGGAVGFAWIGDIQQKQERIDHLMERLGGEGVYDAMRQGKIKQGVKRMLFRTLNNEIFDVVEHLNYAFENASRLAAFRASVEAGISPREAGRIAKQVTTNFNDKGEVGGEFNSLYLFANAAIQGTSNIARVMAGKQSKHKRQVYAIIGTIIGLGVLAGMDDDDEDKDLVPDYEKRRNWIIDLGDGKRLTIPKPYGWAFFHDFGRSIAHVSQHGEKSALHESIAVAGSFLENFSPVNPMPNHELDGKDMTQAIMPTIIKPFVQSGLNRNSFGSEIMPDDERRPNQPDSMKEWRKTRGSMYEALAQGMNKASGGDEVVAGAVDVSPETLKLIASFLTGGAGRFASDSVSSAFELSNTGETKLETAPVVKQFYKHDDVDAFMRRFYDQAEEVGAQKEIGREYRKLQSDEGDAGFDRVMDNPISTLPSDNVRSQISRLRDEQDEIRADKKLTNEEKKAKLAESEGDLKERLKDFNMQFKEAKKLGLSDAEPRK